jgi:hypothetical protein
VHYPTYNRSQSAVATTLHPAFITGFSDAESCFNINITKSKTHKIGWVVQLCFIISLHKKDTALLEQIKYSLGVGNVKKQGKDSIQLRVSSVKDLQVIVDLFDKYPLITQKLADYLLFKRAFELINRKEHLTTEG